MNYDRIIGNMVLSELSGDAFLVLLCSVFNNFVRINWLFGNELKDLRT